MEPDILVTAKRIVDEAFMVRSWDVWRDGWERELWSIVARRGYGEVEAIRWDRYGVLLSEHGPVEPERFRGLVEGSYVRLCNRLRDGLGEIPDEVPISLREMVYRVHGSRIRAVEMLPDVAGLTFEELVKVHDGLVDGLAYFEASGNLYQSGEIE